MHRARSRCLVLWLASLLLLTACGAAAKPQSVPAAKPQPVPPATSAAATPPAPKAPAPAPAKQPQKATLRLDYILYGYHAPFYLALNKGYYRAAGIDLSIGQGSGSSTTAQLVANGSDTFGLVDGGTMMALISKGLRVKMVMGVLEQSPNAVLSLHRSGIGRPADLVGKRVGFTPGTSTYILFPAFLSANGLKQSQLQMTAVSAQDMNQALMSGKISAALTFNLGNVPLIDSKGFQASSIDYASAGVNVPSLGIVVSDRTAAQEPALVKAFVAATLKGYQAAQADPAAAIAAMAQDNPNVKLDKPLQQKILEQSFQLLHSKNTQGHPLGWMSQQDWTQAQDLLVRYEGIKPQASIGNDFTNAFLPGS